MNRVSAIHLSAKLLGTSCLLAIAACEPEFQDGDEASHEEEDLAPESIDERSFTPVAPLRRVYSLYNATTTDQLLTQYKDEYDWLPTAGLGWLQEIGGGFYLEKQPQSTTLPLRRFYKGTPQTEHFYTTDAIEAANIQSQGWVDEGIVGHIYKDPLPGSVPLYRLVKWNGQTMDLVHRFTTSTAVANNLKSQGYTQENATGYVSLTATPQVASGHVFGTRLGCNGIHDLSCSFGLFHSVSSTVKPVGKTTQVMRFRLWTPDMFTVQGVAAEDHLLFVPRGILQPNYSDLAKSKIHGIGLIIGAGGGGFGCGASGVDKPFLEEWWPLASPPSQPGAAVWNGNNYVCDPSKPGTCDRKNTCGASKLQNNTWYDVSLSVSDSGQAVYNIYQANSLKASGSAVYGSVAKYPAETAFNKLAQGYFLHSAPMLQRDHTAYVTNFSVTWE